MKKSLGSILVLFLLPLGLYAKELASYTLYADKTEVYNKEAVVISFEAHQQDHSHVMFFFAKPKPSKNYSVKLFTKTIDNKSYHDTSAVFQYVLFPHTGKDLTIDFEFIVKTASDQAVAHAFVEDHDDSVGIVLQSNHIQVRPLHLKIKPLPANVNLVGDFTLTPTIDHTAINQYDSVNIHYILKGSGYENIENPISLSDKINTFSETNLLKKKLTKKGYAIQKDFTYALSSEDNFEIPSVSIQAFSPSKKKLYTLEAPAYKISVDKIDPKTLLDKNEQPVSSSVVSLATIKTYAIYLIIFILGYMSAKLKGSFFPFSRKKEQKHNALLNADTPKETIFILLENYSHISNVNNYIERLENIEYRGSKESFKEIKKELLEELKL